MVGLGYILITADKFVYLLPLFARWQHSIISSIGGATENARLSVFGATQTAQWGNGRNGATAQRRNANGATQTAQRKWRNANGATQMAQGRK